MDYYIFAADVYCCDCGERHREELSAVGEAPANPANETTYDSGDFPKGPYSDSESDTPQNCADCGFYIEGPLTDDGVDYVIEAMNDDIQRRHTNSIVRDWAAHLDKGLGYNLTTEQQAIYDEYTKMFDDA